MPYLLSEILRPFLNILLAIGIFIGIGYILRLLRKKYVWADYLTYAIIILVPIWIWYINNKDIGALIGFGCMFSIPVYYTSGLNVKTRIRNNRGIYNLWCSKCRCKDLEIICVNDDYVKARCKRCNQIMVSKFTDKDGEKRMPYNHNIPIPAEEKSSLDHNSRDDSDKENRRNLYNYHKSYADDYYREYEYYKSKAREARSQADTYRSYGEDYERSGRNNNDERDINIAQEYYNKANYTYREADTFESKADYYYNQYLSSKSAADSYR